MKLFRKKEFVILSSIFLLISVFFTPIAYSQEDVATEDCPSNDLGGALRLPFEGAWGISQGYRGPVSHKDGYDIEYAIDFNLPGSQDANQPVFAPADGEIVRSMLSGNELVCFDLDGSLGSVEIGHLAPSPKTLVGRNFDRGDQIGKLIAGATTYSSGPHIHIAYYDDDECRTISKPFDNMFGGEINLPNVDGAYDVWVGAYLGCGEIPEADTSFLDSVASWLGFGNELDEGDSGWSEKEEYIDYGYGEFSVASEPIDNYITTIVVKLGNWGPDSFLELTYIIIDTIVRFAFLLVVLDIVYAAFLFVLSRGNEEMVDRARRSLKYLVYGLAIIIAALMVKGGIQAVEWLLEV